MAGPPETDIQYMYRIIYASLVVHNVYKLQAAPWDAINFRFYFRTEVVYPTDHVFIFFRIFIFLQIFLINISMKPEITQTNYLYTWRTIDCFHSIGPHADGIVPALGKQSVLQVCPPVSWIWDTN